MQELAAARHQAAGRYDNSQQQQMPYRQPAQNTNDALYQQLLPHVWHVLEVVVQNEFEESTTAVTAFIVNFRWADGSGIAEYFQDDPASANVLRGRILEVFANWVRQKSRELDYMVFTLQAGQYALHEAALNCTRQIEQACYQTNWVEVIAEFLFAMVVDVLGSDSACLASLLAGQLISEVGQNRQDILTLCECPSKLLSHMVCKLEELQAKVIKIVMELYHESGFQSYDESKYSFMMFFPYYTVETTTGTLEVHETATEGAFAESLFRVALIDCHGLLMKLLLHLEFLCSGGNGSEVVVAVDFEGVKLCRHGALCLVQMTCSDDPTLVYVLDIHLLEKRAFTMATPNGTSMQGILEDEKTLKVWFDPRNDIDALYHQFGIMPRGIFDLQLAEVADRRKRGLNVHFVQGLYKCLTQCPALQAEQKVFAQKINDLGKSLFEPQNGGNYEIFQQRPLNPVILVYAAHDSRYMLLLYEQYLSTIGERWVPRVLRAADVRARWCLKPTYTAPNSEAPEF